jgi:riboflavin biosynthesis pyrimidine reductase
MEASHLLRSLLNRGLVEEILMTIAPVLSGASDGGAEVLLPRKLRELTNDTLLLVSSDQSGFL